jgi:hypothetical protein
VPIAGAGIIVFNYSLFNWIHGKVEMTCRCIDHRAFIRETMRKCSRIRPAWVGLISLPWDTNLEHSAASGAVVPKPCSSLLQNQTILF